MAPDDETRDDEAPGDEPVVDDGDEDEDDDGEPQDEEAVAEAAAAIELVVLPIACISEGKGAPLAMGVQRWWAQELAGRGAKAAAPVFTAMAEQGGRKIPALMVFREPWTDERALEGIARFPNAKRGLVAQLQVGDKEFSCSARLCSVEDGKLVTGKTWDWTGPSGELPAQMHVVLRDLAEACGVEVEEKTWNESFGTSNTQALTSFLVGLGNLSALQGRCVPAGPEQLLAPFVDALNRDPAMDAAMQGLHMMTDILVQNPIDQSAIPLSIQALNIAAQKRKDDQTVYHHLGSILRRLGDVGSAVQAFNQAFNIDPTNEAVTVQFIDTLRGAGDKGNAMKVAQFAAERGNESPRVMARLGSLMIEHDHFDEAEPFLRRAIEEGKVPSAYGDLANVLWDRGEEGDDDRAESLSLLRTAIELPAVAKTTLDMLLDLHEEEKNEEATMLLVRAAEKHPGDATALRYVATMYLDGDDPAKAREWLDKILELPRRTLDDDAFARRGRLQLDMEDFEERYDQAIDQVRSSDAKAQVEAAKFLRQVIGKDERFWQPHLMLALAVRESEGDDAALAHLRNAVRLRPNDAEIRNLLAAILRKQGRPREAVEHLRAVVALNPRDVEPVLALAASMRDANLFGEARQVCNAALQMLPSQPELKRFMPEFKRILDSLPPPGADEEDDDEGDDDGESDGDGDGDRNA
jgi:tetratricopeptide (TPR) repeat protein